MTERRERSRGPVDPGVLEAVSTLVIEVRRVVEGLQGGGHASLHQGASVEFAEHKKYCPGDDIRHIDWRALARTDRYFIKAHEREVTLRCLLMLDCSSSMAYQGSRATRSKLDYARVLLGAMAHVLVRQGDAVGLLPFASSPLPHLPPDRKPEYLPALMNRLASLRPAQDGGTGFVEAIHRAADHAGRRAMIVMATDLWDADRDVEVALTSLASRGHDVTLFHVLSPDEIDFPFDTTATFEGMEGDGGIQVDPALVREDYRQAVIDVDLRWRRVIGEAQMDLVSAATDKPPEAVLADFASRRHRAARRR